MKHVFGGFAHQTKGEQAVKPHWTLEGWVFWSMPGIAQGSFSHVERLLMLLNSSQGVVGMTMW